MTPRDGDGLDGAGCTTEAGRVVEFDSINDPAIAENSPHPQAAHTAVRPVDRVVIVVAPVGRGKFRASLEDGPELVPASATPFLGACRKLLDLGCYDPRQRAVMRHLGTDHDALSATIGAAAGLTVAESGTPRFARLPSDGLSSRDGSPPIAQNDGTVTQVPEAPARASEPARRGADGEADIGASA
jgi:hypothetical protein